jgi:hypothetical protein
MAAKEFLKSNISLVLAIICFLYLTQVTIFAIHADTWFDPAFSLEVVHKIGEVGILHVGLGYFFMNIIFPVLCVIAIFLLWRWGDG